MYFFVSYRVSTAMGRIKCSEVDHEEGEDEIPALWMVIVAPLCLLITIIKEGLGISFLILRCIDGMYVD